MQPPNDLESKRLRRRKLLIRASLAALSFGAGMLCGYLPEEHQGICKLAAKVMGFVLGGG